MRDWIEEVLVGEVEVQLVMVGGSVVSVCVCVCLCVDCCRELERDRERYGNMTLEDFEYFMDGENSTSMLISDYMKNTAFKGISVS